MKRVTVYATLLLVFATITPCSQAFAETFAFQFVCHTGNTEFKTPWMDERLSTAVSFSRGREGQNFYWAKFDQGPYGLGAAPMHPAAGDNLWAWVEHRSALSCNEVCLNLQAIDGNLASVSGHESSQNLYGKYTYPNRVVIRRYEVDLGWRNDDIDDNRITKSSWNLGDLSDEEIVFRRSAANSRRDEGVSYCWSEWTDHYWATLYRSNGEGRITEVTLNDRHQIPHRFRAVPAYPEP